MKTLKSLLAWAVRSQSQATRPARPSPRRAGRRGMLAIECLEDRTAPATLTVTSAADTLSNQPLQPGTLRAAVAQANTDAAAGQSDTINFAPGLGTITLASLYSVTPPINIPSTPLTLTHTGSSLATVTIDGGGQITVSGPADPRQGSGVFAIKIGYALSVRVALVGLTITQGHTTGDGGGIDNFGGKLTVTNCTLSGNYAQYDGGALASHGHNRPDTGILTVSGCTFSSNSAGGNGGGIFNKAGPASTTGNMTVNNCIFSGNSAGANGGAIYNQGGDMGGTGNTGQLTVSGCTITGNSAGLSGGGIYSIGYERPGWVGPSGDLTVTGSTITGNSAGVDGGGIYHYGCHMTLSGDTVNGNTPNDIV